MSDPYYSTTKQQILSVFIVTMPGNVQLNGKSFYLKHNIFQPSKLKILTGVCLHFID